MIDVGSIKMRETTLTEIYDSEYFKMSRKVVQDLTDSIAIIDKVLPFVYAYKRYSAMLIIYETMKDQKKYMELQLEKYKKIKAKKGRVR